MAGDNGGVRNFLDLPVDCIADIFSFTSPREICRLSTVSPKFRDLLQSDAVWNRFLPSDVQSIISQSSDSSLLNRCDSKKQLYLSLCDNPIIIEQGRKSFALVKVNGKKTYMISARDLKIVWDDTPEYWRWRSVPNSRFGEVAELLTVCWFDIKGKINTQMLSPGTMYEAYLVYPSAKRTHGLGFDYRPADVTVGLVGTEGCQLTRHLIREKGMRPYGVESDRKVGYRRRKDGWIEIKLGEFFNKKGQDGDLEISILEVKGGHWKGGILVQGIEIRPTRGST